MKKGKILKNLIRKYCLKHGDFLNINDLKFIAAKEKMSTDDLITILGISSKNKWRIIKNPSSKTRINILNLEELKNVEICIKSEVNCMLKINYSHLNRLCNKYKINIYILNKILNISKDQYYNLRKGQKNIYLRPPTDEKEIMSDLLVEELKYEKYITKKQVDFFKQKYSLTYDEICFALKVKTSNFKKLINGFTKKMRIDLQNQFEKNKLLQDIKLKIDRLKMDIKYIYGEGFFTQSQIRKLCKKYEIEIDDFIRSLCNTEKSYLFIKVALRENPDGIFIGDEHKLSDNFVNKYEKRLENMCRKITNKYCYFSYLTTEKQDISQEAFMFLFQKCGIIEKNFSYDENLLFNILANKIKYFVIGKRNKRYQEILLDNFDLCTQTSDVYSIFNISNVSFTPSLDNRIQLVHQYVMKIFQDNDDFIYNNRNNAYKIISYKLKISRNSLESIINEIKHIYLEYGFAKECLNGNILDMSNSENFI